MMEMESIALKSKRTAPTRTFAMFMLTAFSMQPSEEALAYVKRATMELEGHVI